MLNNQKKSLENEINQIQESSAEYQKEPKILKY